MQIVSLRVHTDLSHGRVHFFEPSLRRVSSRTLDQEGGASARRVIRHCDTEAQSCLITYIGRYATRTAPYYGIHWPAP